MAQSTAQSAYQWTKTNIEAMTDANWEESGGWSTSVNTVDWTYRLVTGLTAASPTTNTGYALSAAITESNPYTITASTTRSGCEAYKAFDQTTGVWGSANTVTTGYIQIDLGAGNAKLINRYQLQAGSDSSGNQGFPAAWTLYGSNNGSDWTSLDSRSGITSPGQNAWWPGASSYRDFTNTTAYRYFKFEITATVSGNNGYFMVGELKLILGSTQTATPTYTKTTFNHDTEYVALDLRTNGWEASANDPTDGYVVLDVEPVDSITNNTDIKTYISIDDGSHYEQVTLESTPFRTIGVHNYIRGDISGITARTDKTIKFKVTSHNSKNFKVHGLGGGVKY